MHLMPIYRFLRAGRKRLWAALTAALLAAGLGGITASALAALPSPYTGVPPLPKAPKAPKINGKAPLETNGPPGPLFTIPEPPLASPPDDPPPEQTPEPAALITGLLGAGMTGIYALRRRLRR
jgi:hypothetical protein